MHDPVERLLRAWTEWDANRGDPGRAGEMEDACWEVAAIVGCGANDLRIGLSTYRKQGLSRRQAITKVVGA